MRVHELARSLKIDNRKVVQIAKDIGLDVANSMSTITDEEANQVRDFVSNKKKKQKRAEESVKPRVNVEEIEKRLARREKEEKERQKKEAAAKKKEAEEKAKKEKAEREKAEKEKAEREKKEKAEKAKEAEKIKLEEKELEKNQKKTKKSEKDRPSKAQEKKTQKPKKDTSKTSKRTKTKKDNLDREMEQSIEPEKKDTRKKSKTKQQQKNARRENKKFSDRDSSKKKPFKRDLTKKTGIAVSKQKAAQRKAEESSKESDENKVYEIEMPVTVKEFAEAIGMTSAEIITKLMGLGVMATINQNLDEEAVEILALELGIEVKTPEPEVEIPIEEQFGLDQEEDKEEDLKLRAPVVTVMGHVDHGKTSLLDKIKSTKVTAGEAGGITQHIGAYTVRVNDKKITFLDTPGHEAFTMMRMRGTQVTDIAILVVAADDGVMPQTIEAISHARSAEVPIIVAINKIDKPDANPERVKQELVEQGLVPEEWGGTTITVPVSAKTGEGIDELLEMVLLLAEVQELKANPNRLAVASVIEAELDVGKGPVATVLVQKGTLRVGDSVASGMASGKIRNMINDKGKEVKKAGPSTPVEIQGLSEVPNAGDQLFAFEDEKTARDFADKVRDKYREDQLKTHKITLDDLFSKIKEGELKELNLIVKGDVKGSVEALNQSIMKIESDEVKINIVHSGVGGIVESDISLASAANAIIIGFNVRPNNNSLDIAKEENIEIKTYRVIYQVIEDIEAAVKGMHAPKFVENYIGRVEVRDTFKLPNGTIVAGGYVISGKITRDSLVKILRDDIIIHEGEIASLRRFKDDVREVTSGYECGIGIENYNDIKVGDIIEASIMEEVGIDE